MPFFFLSFYFLAIFVFIFVVKSYHKQYGSILSPSVFLLISYFITNHIGLIVLYFNQGGMNKIEKIDVHTLAILAFYSIVVTLCFVFTNFCYPDRRPLVYKVSSKEQKIYGQGIFYILLLSGATIAVQNFLSNSPLIIFIETLDASSGMMNRIADRNNNMSYGVVSGLIFELLKFYLIVQVIAIHWHKRKREQFFLFVNFVICLLWYSANLSKGFLAYPIMIWIILQIYRGKIYKINWSNISILFATFIIIPVITKYIMGHDGLILYYPIERVVLSNLFPQYVIVNNFSSDYLFGLGLPSWISFYSHSQIDLTELAWQLMNPTLFEKLSMAYSNPASFVSSGHANGGFIGVLVITLLAFFYLSFLKTICYHVYDKNRLFGIAIEIYLCLLAFNLSITHLVPKFMDLKIWVVMLFAALISSLKKKI